MAGIAILALQGFFAFSLTLNEHAPTPPPLSEFPSEIKQWRSAGQIPMEKDVYQMLLPDDYLDRVYRQPAKEGELGLFIAYYKSQHRAAGAHDPKICLPGSGWNPVSSTLIQIPVGKTVISANQYVVSKGSMTDLVVYWYQTERRSVAGTEGLHVNRILETFMDNRTDMALVRIVVPVAVGGIPAANAAASEFATAAYPDLMRQFPPRDAAN
jgi:EpsI family protein